jgi:ATP/maltotriose-dependent transcriptional regulator MalT
VEKRIEPDGSNRQAGADEVANDALDRVTELLDHSLIHPFSYDQTEPRFAMYQTIQEFAQELLIHHKELEAVQRAHAEFVANLVEQAEPELTGENQLIWFDRLEAEHDNIRAALNWAIAAGNARLAHRIVSALWRFWWNRGFLHEGRQWFAQALMLGDGELTPERTRALHGAGQLADTQGDYEQAVRLYREALSGARELGDEGLEATVLDAMANEAHDRGRYDEAIRSHEEAREIFARLGDRRGLAACLHNLATVHYYRGDLETADTLYAQSLVLIRALGDQRNVGNVLGSLGSIAHAKGEFERARELLDQSRDIYSSLGDELGTAITDINLGDICFNLGDYAEGGALSQSALDVCLKLGTKRFAAHAQLTLGRIARADGEPGEAAQHFTQSFTTFVELGDLAHTAECLELLGGLAAVLGDIVRGVQLMAAANAIRCSTGAVADPRHLEVYEQDIAALRRACPEDAFTTAWNAGRAQSMEVIIAGVRELSNEAATTPAERVVLAAAEELGLSRREVEVLRLFADGYTSQQIADTLAISPTTVMTHIGNLYLKLGTDSRAGLAAYAFKTGLV